jgi:hypothetical protein
LSLFETKQLYKSSSALRGMIEGDKKFPSFRMAGMPLLQPSINFPKKKFKQEYPPRHSLRQAASLKPAHKTIWSVFVGWLR